jgi:putative dehydrogenase
VTAKDIGKTVGLLYPGEMGAALASLLHSRGARIVTTVDGRGPRTADRCREAGCIVLDSLADVARQSNVVVSLVPPAAAEEIADRYCEFARSAPPNALYVDANSIRPELARSIAAKLNARGRGFVDAAINGLAKNLSTTGTLFLSGPRSGEIAQLFGDAMRVRTLGDESGRASAMKMLLSGLSKGVCALFLELAMTAQRDGMLEDFLAASGTIYPEITALADRMLPTYARHAGRRATEMNELESTVRAAGVEPTVIAAVRQLHEMLATVPFAEDANAVSIASLIDRALNAK